MLDVGEHAGCAQGAKLAIKHTTRWARALVKDLQYQLDVNTLHRDEDAVGLSLNEIGRVTLRTTLPLFYDEYRRNRDHRQLHPRRRGHQHHRRRRHDPRPARRVSSDNVTWHPGHVARDGPAVARAPRLAHRACRARASRRWRRRRGAAGRRRPAGLRARRRQPPPRPQRRPRVLGRRTAPRTSAGSARSPA